MTRRKQRSYGRSGLFEYALTGDVTDVPDNPLTRPCPSDAGGYGAAAGQRCTRPGRGGRVELKGYHPARSSNEVPKPEAPQVIDPPIQETP